MSENNSFIDELWINSSNKIVPLGPSITDIMRTDWMTYLFSTVDKTLWSLNGPQNNPLRGFSRKKCISVFKHCS
ncbi:hypothetical protein RRF57_012667 [Xylaria bambusicola]|uniref:Uncharacterized protein n=1 Tax=Xylaria bambusicola TaxID=326684 RepID=A0AAN7UQ96_9PEZI